MRNFYRILHSEVPSNAISLPALAPRSKFPPMSLPQASYRWTLMSRRTLHTTLQNPSIPVMMRVEDKADVVLGGFGA